MNKMSRSWISAASGSPKTSLHHSVGECGGGNTWEYELDWTDSSAAQNLLPEETLVFQWLQAAKQVFWGNNARSGDSKHLN